jgi:hypothetical protein
MTYKMYDNANSRLLAGTVADAYAGYVDGIGAGTYVFLTQHYPGKHLLSITVHGNGADVLDIEGGAASVGMAPSWLKLARLGKNHTVHTPKPVLYWASGNSAANIAFLTRAGVPRSSYLLWSAHVGRGRHICGPATCGFPAANGTQWTFTALGRSLDESVLGDEFFATVTPPKPPAPVGPFRHVADGTKSLAQVAAERGTTVHYIVGVSVTKLSEKHVDRLVMYLANKDGAAALMPKGLVYWTHNQ